MIHIDGYFTSPIGHLNFFSNSLSRIFNSNNILQNSTRDTLFLRDTLFRMVSQFGLNQTESNSLWNWILCFQLILYPVVS